MMPRNKWSFVAAVVWLFYASLRLQDLYESRDLSEDWGALVALAAGILFLRGAYRKDEEEAAK